MTQYTYAVIGTGPDPENPSREGFAMGYAHAEAFEADDRCELVGCADIAPENGRAFAEAFDLPESSVYEDYRELLDEVDPDVVSVCVPPSLHAEIVVDCIRHGNLDAIHCEKPMDLVWENCELMTLEAERNDVQLTFNHQRRFGAPFRNAKALLDEGRIGDLQRIEIASGNLYDYGSHSIDLANYFNDERSAEWVISGIDYRTENVFFGAHNENQSVTLWQYDNGVHGFASTDEEPDRRVVDAHHRLVGTDGVIEIGPESDEIDAVLRVRSNGGGWETIDCDGETVHGPNFIRRAVEEVVDALDSGAESQLRAENALAATEIIFGAWESARRRGRVEFPLDVDDNPLEAMVESGDLDPAPREE